jgi:hypothetical protein
MTLQLGGGGAITGCTSLQEPALTLSGLTVSGPFDVEKIIVSSGTAAAPTYTFSGDTDNGLYYAGTNSIGLATNGTNAILIDSTGNVGIGTSSPITRLHINSGTTDLAGILESSDANVFLAFKDGSTSGNQQVQIGAVTNNLVAYAGGSERLRIDSAGRLLVGLATSNDTVAGTQSNLIIESNSSGDASYGGLTLQRGSSSIANEGSLGRIFFTAADGRMGARISSLGGGTWASGSSPGQLAFDTVPPSSESPVERMRIDENGAIAVGETTSTAISQVGASTVPFSIIDLTNGPTLQLRGQSPKLFFDGTNSGNGEIYMDGADLAVYSGSPTTPVSERLRIDSSGNMTFPGSPIISTGYNMYLKAFNNIEITADSDSSGGGYIDFRIGSASKARVDSGGSLLVGRTSNVTGGSGGNFAFVAQCFTNEENRPIAAFRRSTYNSVQIFGSNGGDGNSANCIMRVRGHSSGNRSINAGGSVNASGADYAEYMTKDGEFTIAKGDICGVTFDGKLTNNFADAISFVVKSTDPSYIGNDVWGIDVKNEEQREVARQMVDRIAFAGQVPVNVTGATPGQYIVPIQDDGGISGIAKDETDLTLTEYMQAVGKVIAIEDDGRARIIVKVA